MQIRKFDQNNTAELNQVYRIQIAAYTVEAAIIGAEVFPPLHGTRNELRDSREEGFVYLIDEVVVGAVFLEMTASSVLIAKLIVEPVFFRRGIAKALIRYCLELYPETAFEVGTGSANFPALALYRSFGFRIFEDKLLEDGIRISRLRRESGSGIDVVLD